MILAFWLMTIQRVQSFGGTKAMDLRVSLTSMEILFTYRPFMGKYKHLTHSRVAYYGRHNDLHLLLMPNVLLAIFQSQSSTFSI